MMGGQLVTVKAGATETPVTHKSIFAFADSLQYGGPGPIPGGLNMS